MSKWVNPEWLAEKVWQGCGSQLPDKTRIIDLSWENILMGALSRNLTKAERSYLVRALTVSTRALKGESLDDLRHALTDPGEIAQLYNNRLVGPITVSFLRRAFVGTTSANGETVDQLTTTAGQQLDELLSYGGLDAEDLASLEKILLKHARELIQLVKQVQRKS